jgi:stringent starvation protein B
MKSSKPYFINAIYEWIVDNDCTPHILVKADHKGVVVPTEFVKDGQIVLNISMNAVTKLVLDKTLISFDGRFKGVQQSVHIPLGAVMGIYARENGEGMFFDLTAEKPDVDEPVSSVPQEKAKPTLRIVK